MAATPTPYRGSSSLAPRKSDRTMTVPCRYGGPDLKFVLVRVTDEGSEKYTRERRKSYATGDLLFQRGRWIGYADYDGTAHDPGGGTLSHVLGSYDNAIKYLLKREGIVANPAKKKAAKKKPFKRGAKWRSDTEIEIRKGTFLGLTKDTGDPYLFNVVGYVGTPVAYEEARKHGLIGPKTASQRALESRFDRPKRKRKKAARKRNAGGINYLAAGVVGAVAYLAFRLFKKGKRAQAPIVEPRKPVVHPIPPPPVPRPDVPVVAFQPGEETVMTLPQGAEWLVAYDEESPLSYHAVESDAVQVVEDDPGATPRANSSVGHVRFRVMVQLPTGSADHVYFQSGDQDTPVLGEHKFTVIGP